MLRDPAATAFRRTAHRGTPNSAIRMESTAVILSTTFTAPSNGAKCMGKLWIPYTAASVSRSTISTASVLCISPTTRESHAIGTAYDGTAPITKDSTATA